MSSVRALSVTALVVVAASVAVAGPGLVGATWAGNHAAAGNTPTDTQTAPATTAAPSGGTNVTNGTTPTGGNTAAGGNTSADGNTTAEGNTSKDGNTTRDGNTTARSQAIERGPARRPNPRPRGPRISPDVVVDDDGKAHYRTLSAAVEDARENETILVHPGTYDGGVRVDVDGLTIVGVGPEGTELVGTGTGTAVVVAASDVTVQSVGVNGYRSGVVVEAGDGEVTENVELANVTIERVSGDVVRIEARSSTATVSNVTIESSELRLGGVVGWSGANASIEGNSSDDGGKGNASKAGSVDNGSATGIAVGDGPVTGVAIESRAGSVTDVRVVDSSVTDLGTGMRLSGPDGSISGVQVVESEFDGNDRGVDVADGAVHSVAVRETDLVDNGVGLLVREPVGPSAVTVRESRFADNDVGLWSRAAGTLDAEGNDWGAPSGPAAPGNPSGGGDVVHGAVDVDPWLPPVVRLEDAVVSSDRLTIELVAHAEGVAEYEVAAGHDPARVDDVAVEGGAMTASIEVDGDALVISGDSSTAVEGPVVLATIVFEGDLESVADELELRGERSVAYDGKGRALDAAFLTGNLSVDVEDGGVEEPPTETPTEGPADETPTETATPNGMERTTVEETPQMTVTDVPEPETVADSPVSAATGGQSTDGGRQRQTTDTTDGETERPTDGPDPLGLPAIQRRLAVVGDALSELGEFLRSLVAVAASR